MRTADSCLSRSSRGTCFRFRTLLLIALLVVMQTPLTVSGISVWNTDLANQQGQFTFYNSKVDGAFFGLPVDAGNFNNDGFTDLAISPMAASSGPISDRSRAGEVYVLRGDGSFIGLVDHAQFTNATFPGLTVLGARAGDFFGVEMFSANINNDDFEDLIIGAQNYDGPNGDRSNCGGAFIILGGSDVLADGSVIDLNFDPLSPPPGLITVFGERAGDRLGLWVEAGDFDGDGISDLALGGDQSVGADPSLENTRVGMAAILYGRDTWPALVDLADGPENLADVAFFYGKDSHDHFGSTLHGADIDNDGEDELVISASLNRLSASYSDDLDFPAAASGGGDGPNNDRTFSGETYIFYSDGANGRFTGRIDLAESPLPTALDDRLTIIYGATVGEIAGEELASGDFDADGHDELCLGGLTARNPINLSQAGIVWVLDGLELMKGDDLDLDSLGGIAAGVTIRAYYGNAFNMIFGDTMITGDYNFDGFEDLTIGAPHTGDMGEPGQMIMLYGGSEPLGEFTFPLLDVPNNPLERSLVIGPDGGDNFSYSLDSYDWDGDGYWDVIANAMRGDGPNDVAPNLDVGEAHVVSGYHFSDTQLSLDSLEPSEASIGQSTEVVLRGTGFTLGSQVLLALEESTLAENIEVMNANEIRATFPPRAIVGPIVVTVQTMHASTDPGLTFRYEEAFIRGDTDNDGGLTINDPILSLQYMFLTGVGVCLDSHDADDSGILDIVDPITSLFFQLLGGDPLPAPYPNPGSDPTPDSLTCER